MFTPRREHARFCSARCRVTWNRENIGDPQAGAIALDWSITAMRDAVDRLATDQATDHAQALTLISEAVWWVTLVDATLVRYHHQAYEDVMEASAERRSIEGTFAGLRFVRNQMGYRLDPADFIQPGQHHIGADHEDVTAWTWRSLPDLDLSALPPRGRAWEMTRYRAYQARLAGHTLGDTFGRAAGFLTLTSANLAAA
jgi:hypothetical protein